MNKPTWKERFRYRLDNRMARGSISMIRLLALMTLLLVLLITGLILAFGLQEEPNVFSALWDTLAATINAWMPYSDDGRIGYVLLTALAALIGLLFTSVLIGIIASAIEERLTELRKGSSRVLETGHTVVLGFEPGALTLLEQLVLAVGEGPHTFVLAEAMEKDEMEAAIREYPVLPKHVKIICRNADITDPGALYCCNLPAASRIVVSPMPDERALKVVLAARKAREGGEVGIVAAVSSGKYLLPVSFCKAEKILLMNTGSLLARLIAHSCTQPGLSRAFSEVFSFAGSEFYAEQMPETAGLTFGEAVLRMENGALCGLYRQHKLYMNPAAAERLEAGDRLLLFEEKKGAARLGAPVPVPACTAGPCVQDAERTDRVVILGENSYKDMILKELPSDSEVVQAKDAESPPEQLVPWADHVVVLSGDEDRDRSDMKSVLLLIRLQELRRQAGLGYNITVELHREANRKLVTDEGGTDFVVASDMASMVLAQLAETPALFVMFRELLSSEGNELVLRPVSRFALTPGGTYGTAALRQAALQAHCCFLGLCRRDGDGFRFSMDPGRDASFTVRETDQLVVLARA